MPIGTIDRFRSQLAGLWPELAPLCHAEEDDATSLRRALADHAASSGGDRRRPASDLEALLPGWPHFSAPQRAVLAAAVKYLTRDAAGCDPRTERKVADAAVHVLLHRRG